MAQAERAANTEDPQWDGVEETIEDPEEVRVIFCALDSFRSVPSPLAFLFNYRWLTHTSCKTKGILHPALNLF